MSEIFENYFPNWFFCMFLYLLSMIILFLINKMTPSAKKIIKNSTGFKQSIMKKISSCLVTVIIFIVLFSQGTVIGLNPNTTFDTRKMNNAVKSCITELSNFHIAVDTLQINFKPNTPLYNELQNLKNGISLSASYVMKLTPEFMQAIASDQTVPIPKPTWTKSQTLMLQGIVDRNLIDYHRQRQRQQQQKRLSLSQKPVLHNIMSMVDKIDYGVEGTFVSLSYKTDAILQKQNAVSLRKSELVMITNALTKSSQSILSSFKYEENIADLLKPGSKEIYGDATQVLQKMGNAAKSVLKLGEKIIYTYSKQVRVSLSETGMITFLIPGHLKDALLEGIMAVVF